jgi:hypothetical protein
MPPPMTVTEAIHKAEAILPGTPAPDGQVDPRWQAIIAVAEFIEDEPEAVWSFAERWGQHSDEDLRTAIATCVLEHLLEHHFDLVFPRVARLARSYRQFARAVAMCSRFGETEHPANAAKLDELLRELRSAS